MTKQPNTITKGKVKPKEYPLGKTKVVTTGTDRAKYGTKTIKPNSVK